MPAAVSWIAMLAAGACTDVDTRAFNGFPSPESQATGGSAIGGDHARPLIAGERIRPYVDQLHVTAWPRGPAEVERIWALAEHVLSPHDPGDAPHELVIGRATLARLRALGVPLRVDAIDVQAWIDASYEARGAAPVLHHAGKLGIFGSFFDRVQPLAAIESYLAELAQAGQGRAQLSTIGKSVEGRDIKALRVASAPEGSDRPSVIVTGTQHAREWASPMVTLGLADALVRRYDADPMVRLVVDSLEIFIVPMVNPDGYVASHGGSRLQRKNMNPRCNVDLNRNWGEWWGQGVPRTNCGAQTFPGEGAFSEPETQAVRRLAESRRNLRFYMDYHSAARQVMYPMCFERAQPPNLDEDKAWTELYARTLATINGANIPSRHCFGIGGGQGGCSTDWFRKRLPNTIEVELRGGGGPGGFGLEDALVVEFVEENWVAWLAVMVRVAQKYAPAGTPSADAGSDTGGSTRSDGRAADRTADIGTGSADRSADLAVPADLNPGAPPADASRSGPEGRADAALPIPPSAPQPDAANAAGPAASGCACGIGRRARDGSGGGVLGFLLLLLGARRQRAQHGPRLVRDFTCRGPTHQLPDRPCRRP